MKISKQGGFTLVEIAIVLVIIGLLLGGVLKGQELINSARVRSLANQNSGVQAAYYGFVDRYRRVPGDFPSVAATQAIGVTINLPKATTSTTSTTGNGRLDNTLEEAAAVWEQLAKAQFLAGGFTPATTAPDAAGYPAVSPANAFNGALVLSRNQGYSGTRSPRLNLHMGSDVPVALARDLDVKIDDGLPNTGILRLSIVDGVSKQLDSFFVDKTTVCTTKSDATGSSNTAGSNAATDIYDIFDDERNCQPVFVY